ncbi:HIT family protein [Listeria costaricensis]|uniref:HIT family protein n=1 Tax=Listeria costaricensis TaxID=2026604 RepID=UPI000C082D00|nr:HIT domain-containing protein [Listeria costaricensis]
MGDHQYFRGYTLFLFKSHVTELHFLTTEIKMTFLKEMSLVAEACYHAFGAEKMNYELLGNGDSHLHWHLFPRKTGDMPIKGPVWWLDPEVMYSDDVRPTPLELEHMKQRLNHSLDKLLLDK